MRQVIVLYTYKLARPGIEPTEWYSTCQWRFTYKEAANDAAQASKDYPGLRTKIECHEFQQVGQVWVPEEGIKLATD